MVTLQSSAWRGRFVSQLEDKSGPFELLDSRRTVVIADVQNLECGARDLGFRIDWQKLAETIRGAACKCSFHACSVVRPDLLERRRTDFSDAGWNSHLAAITEVQTCRGRERFTNADNLMIFTAGNVLSRTIAGTVVVVASGDGELVDSIAQSVATMPASRTIVTLSLPGSTSFRLDARNHAVVKANLEIGRDCLAAI